MLAMLDDEAEGTYPERERLTKAIIAEHRESGAALWASILLGAFKPMLVRLRNRLVSDTVPCDELDQLVVTAFLAALAELPITESTDRVAMRLRQRTERQVFAFLRKEREHRHPGIDVEELEHLDPDALAPRRARTDEELYDLALLIQRAVQEGISTSGLDVVEATVLRREVLRAYVERLEPVDEVARERLYQRLKRQRSRAMRRLWERCSPPRPRCSSQAASEGRDGEEEPDQAWSPHEGRRPEALEPRGGRAPARRGRGGARRERRGEARVALAARRGRALRRGGQHHRGVRRRSAGPPSAASELRAQLDPPRPRRRRR
ncbi:MAG: hypothetical protein IPN16_15020 [Gemmatimonadetes bacterium]|nr:hypothetical protein [Gemmatimonadota bacterium]